MIHGQPGLDSLSSASPETVPALHALNGSSLAHFCSHLVGSHFLSFFLFLVWGSLFSSWLFGRLLFNSFFHAQRVINVLTSQGGLWEARGVCCDYLVIVFLDTFAGTCTPGHLPLSWAPPHCLFISSLELAFHRDLLVAQVTGMGTAGQRYLEVPGMPSYHHVSLWPASNG